MRRVLVVVLILLGSAGNLLAAPRAILKDETLHQELKKITVFEKQQDFERAQKAYQKILQNWQVSAKQSKKIKKRQQNLNVLKIFSDKKIPGSLIYTVKDGDTLFEIAKKFKTNMELIQKSNSLKEGPLAKDEKLKILKGTFSVKVDKSENVLYLYFDKKLIKEYSVTTGVNNKTPVGKYRIINKIEQPTWYFNDKVIPAGSKKNLLGTRWMGFDKPTYGIHGTVEPEEIGQQASLGCVRMLNEDVEELYILIPLNTAVTIKD